MKIKIEWGGPKIAEDIKQLVNKEICKKTKAKIQENFRRTC